MNFIGRHCRCYAGVLSRLVVAQSNDAAEPEDYADKSFVDGYFFGSSRSSYFELPLKADQRNLFL